MWNMRYEKVLVIQWRALVDADDTLTVVPWKEREGWSPLKEGVTKAELLDAAESAGSDDWNDGWVYVNDLTLYRLVEKGSDR
jgi:hypothetical protein